MDCPSPALSARRTCVTGEKGAKSGKGEKEGPRVLLIPLVSASYLSYLSRLSRFSRLSRACLDQAGYAIVPPLEQRGWPISWNTWAVSTSSSGPIGGTPSRSTYEGPRTVARSLPESILGTKSLEWGKLPTRRRRISRINGRPAASRRICMTALTGRGASNPNDRHRRSPPRLPNQRQHPLQPVLLPRSLPPPPLHPQILLPVDA